MVNSVDILQLIPARPAAGLRRLALRCSFPPRPPRSRPPRRGSLEAVVGYRLAADPEMSLAKIGSRRSLR